MEILFIILTSFIIGGEVQSEFEKDERAKVLEHKER